ncbi:MAG: hypothetical protein UV03_C0008G0001, partial [candidate division WWE3 bacterium GW2011_GWE1_42_16]
VIICDTFNEQLRKQTDDAAYQNTFPIVYEIKRENTPIHVIRVSQRLYGQFNY